MFLSMSSKKKKEGKILFLKHKTLDAGTFFVLGTSFYIKVKHAVFCDVENQIQFSFNTISFLNLTTSN